MYIAAPRWRGTSPVSSPRSARQVRGLSGLGAPTVVIDPTTGEPRVVMDTPINTVTVTPDGDTYYDSQGRVIGTSVGASGGLSWLNDNAGMIALGVGGLLALGLVAKVVRG